MKVKIAQWCPTLCHPRDYTVHGILQARILEWIAFPFSRGSSQPRDQTQLEAGVKQYNTLLNVPCETRRNNRHTSYGIPGFRPVLDPLPQTSNTTYLQNTLSPSIASKSNRFNTSSYSKQGSPILFKSLNQNKS